MQHDDASKEAVEDWFKQNVLLGIDAIDENGLVVRPQVTSQTSPVYILPNLRARALSTDSGSQEEQAGPVPGTITHLLHQDTLMACSIGMKYQYCCSLLAVETIAASFLLHPHFVLNSL